MAILLCERKGEKKEQSVKISAKKRNSKAKLIKWNIFSIHSDKLQTFKYFKLTTPLHNKINCEISLKRKNGKKKEPNLFSSSITRY